MLTVQQPNNPHDLNYHSRRHPRTPALDLTSALPTSLYQTNNSYAYLHPSSPTLNEALLRSYFLSDNDFALDQQSTTIAAVDPVATDALMTSAFDFQGPAIRIQQSTPVPQIPTSYSQASPMLAHTSSDTSRSWELFGGNPSLQTGQYSQRAQLSSIFTSTPNALFHQGHTTATGDFSYSGASEAFAPLSSSTLTDSPYLTANQQSSLNYSNHSLPTPSQTPTSESFLSPSYQTFTPQNSNFDHVMAAQFAYKQAMLGDDDDVPGYTHSSRQSVSSYGNNSPATPRTVVGDDFDEKLKMPSNDLIDGAQDSFQPFYTQPVVPRLQTQLHSQHGKNAHLMPYRTIMAERLQAANNARSQSPTSSGSRAVSPFRHGSPLAPVHNSFGSSRHNLGTVSQAREQTSEAAVKAFALKSHSQSQEQEPKTISPKDALLEYNETEEDSKMPLFPAESDNKFGQHYPVGNYNSVQQNFDTSSEQSFSSMATSRPESWTEPRNFVQGYTTAPSQSTFSFAPPAVPASSLPMPSGNMYMTPHQYRPTSMPMRQESTPDFPAHLTSMESSMSEGGSAEIGIATASNEMHKPGPSAAASGTYSCTYHGCPMRFESPQKLQKHKREGHRQNPTSTVTAGIGSGMSAEELLARNSQAGPHKCERRNPTTGKPCNIMFSRPYDLTRHEDTIHNNRKQKVRCVLCVEEKTFSRNDALTRHMRVVHPEVDYPAKHRRRGD